MKSGAMGKGMTPTGDNFNCIVVAEAATGNGWGIGGGGQGRRETASATQYSNLKMQHPSVDTGLRRQQQPASFCHLERYSTP
jgi:hypothetical protein